VSFLFSCVCVVWYFFLYVLAFIFICCGLWGGGGGGDFTHSVTTVSALLLPFHRVYGHALRVYTHV